MRLTVVWKRRGRKVICVQRNRILLAACHRVVEAAGRAPERIVGELAIARKIRPLGWFAVTRHLLRLGVLNLCPMPDGALIGIARGMIFYKGPTQLVFRVADRFRYSGKPGFNGVCIDGNGWVYYGEYCRNNDRTRPMGLFRSTDGGKSYKRVFEFSAGVVRHIHFVQWDPWGQCLWMGTGDRDEECLLMRSFNSGESWETIGEGSQLWRTGGAIFTEEHLYWGTDAGSVGTVPSLIVRMNRRTAQLNQLAEVQGPCYSCGQLRDGTIVITTGVEGGANEKDGCAHLWASRDGEHWEDLAKWMKNAWPFLVQFGTVHLPHGLETSDDLHFTTLGLRGGAETWHVAKIVD